MKVIYGDDRDDPKDQTRRKLRAILFFEIFLIWPWVGALVFSPMMFGSPGGNDSLLMVALIPFFVYPILIPMFTIISRIEYRKDQFEKAVFIQKLPIVAPPVIFLLLSGINYLWGLIA